MADSYSPFLKVTLPATGAYNNTWGAVLNTDTFSLLDVAISGWTVENLGTATTFSLPALTNGGASDSRYFGLLFEGTPPSQVTVTVPSSVLGKMYLINNTTEQSLEFTYSGSSDTVTVPPSVLQLIWCDGSNCWPVTAIASSSPSLGGVPAANWVQGQYTAAQIAAATIVQNLISIPTAWPYYTQADGGQITFDCHNGVSQQVTLAGSRIVNAPVNVVDGSDLDLAIIQDSVGSRLLSWNSVFLFENGLPPVLGTTPGAIDRFTMRFNFSLGRWLVAHYANLNAGGGTTTGITISSNCMDWSLAANIGTPTAPAIYNITIAQGVVIEASSAGIPAMDLTGVLSGSTINIINNGSILGHGGDGARGGGWVGGVSFGFVINPTAGKPGGPAINGPGSGVTLNIANGNGQIWGGGGGGGSAGFSYSTGAGNQASTGGGGGGAGYGRGGICYPLGDSSNTVVGSDGADGTFSLVNTAFGAAGSSAIEGTTDAGASGAGGDWGTVGANGTAAGTSHTKTVVPTNGGAAGNAINLNGGAANLTGTGASTPPHLKGALM